MVCTENMFREHVPAGTVPRTSVNARSVYREHVPRTCSRWNCTENKYERPEKRLEAEASLGGGGPGGGGVCPPAWMSEGVHWTCEVLTFMTRIMSCIVSNEHIICICCSDWFKNILLIVGSSFISWCEIVHMHHIYYKYQPIWCG